MRSNEPKKTLRLASYNIRKARGSGWKHDPARVVSVVNDLGADVVALQEADHRLGERPAALPAQMIEAETDFRVAPVAVNDVSIGWHGNAVLVHKSLGHGPIKRVDLPGLEPRGAVSIRISGEIEFDLVGTHLGLMRSHRRQQLQVIVDQMSEEHPTVVLGDFNEWRVETGLEPLAERFSVIAPGRSYHASRPVAALDRIAHCGRVSLVNAGVMDSDTARKASDHIPVWADVEFSDKRRQIG